MYIHTNTTYVHTHKVYTHIKRHDLEHTAATNTRLDLARRLSPMLRAAAGDDRVEATYLCEFARASHRWNTHTHTYIVGSWMYTRAYLDRYRTMLPQPLDDGTSNTTVAPGYNCQPQTFAFAPRLSPRGRWAPHF
jgi:hypothetical protein